jgi:hypothetical protein
MTIPKYHSKIIILGKGEKKEHQNIQRHKYVSETNWTPPDLATNEKSNVRARF